MAENNINLLSLSNIAWSTENDTTVYAFMQRLGFTGLEIAPTRIFPQNPYSDLNVARVWANELNSKYGFSIASMQSIWYGKSEKLFGTAEEQKILLDYTKLAIDFAQSIGCKNLVFGCPKNRNVPDGFSENDVMKIAEDFFAELGEYAEKHNTVLALEANPTIYGTNFINTTEQAIALVEKINCKGFKLNLDLGTMIQNCEDVKILRGKIHLVNHVHISEPNLKLIEKRDIHKELAELLRSENYSNYISIEMGNRENISEIEKTCEYVREIFFMIYEKQDGVPKFSCEEFLPKQKDYVLLIPIINEGERIHKELERAKLHNVSNFADIVICDGGSTDGCNEHEKLKSLCVNTLLTKMDYGKQGVQLRMGIWWAIQRGYKGVITIDGNNKDSIEDVPRFIEKLNEGYDFVQGSRFVKGGKAINTPFIRLVSVKLIHAPIISITARHRFTDTTNAFRAYSIKYLIDERVQPLREVFQTYELLAYLSVRATQIGLNACEIPVTREYPKGEKTPTKISFFKGNGNLLKILFRNLFGAYNPK